MYLGKFLVASLTGALAFVLSAYWPWVRDSITTPIIPCVACAIISYVIASIFMSVFSMASNAIMQCFLYDMEIAKIKSDGGADHQPQSLQGFINAVEARHDKKEERKRAKMEKKANNMI